MPSILSDADKQTVKRTVPKSSNKIFAVAVARLYIAYPNPNQWVYTGLQGAAVLCDDTVGHTLWIKLVDISSSNLGVIWDQEIYESFSFNQDRTFFYSFEIEGCLAGLAFSDEKEAKTFKKKMDERDRLASKGTRGRPFVYPGQETAAVPEKHHGGLLGFFGIGARSGSASHHHHLSSAPQSIIPPREGSPVLSPIMPASSMPVIHKRRSHADDLDPTMLKELKDLGISQEQIDEHADFIKLWLSQRKAKGLDSEPSGKTGTTSQARSAIPPPPPPPPAPPASFLPTPPPPPAPPAPPPPPAAPVAHPVPPPPPALFPQSTGSSGGSKRGPPPAPPPARRAGNANSQSGHKFQVPPPLPDAGKLVNSAPSLPPRGRGSSVSASGPPALPNSPRSPVASSVEPSRRFAVPPPPPSTVPAPPPLPPKVPVVGNSNPPPIPARVPISQPPAPPAALPPPLPPHHPPASSRPPPTAPPPLSSSAPSHHVPPAPAAGVPPPPPPMSAAAPSAVPPPPPAMAPSLPAGVPPPPPPLASVAPAGVPPPPPPMMSGPTAGVPPPPPSMPSSIPVAPPPPPMPPTSSAPRPSPMAAPNPMAPGGDRSALWQGIQSGVKLRKVPQSEKNDRSAAIVGGSSGGDKGSAAPVGGAPSTPGGGMADALKLALEKRKNKVRDSDDENDGDEW